MRTVVVTALAITMLQSGCGQSNTLTRSKAANLISAEPEFKPQKTKIKLTENEVKRGVAAGYWARKDVYGFSSYMAMTPKGLETFHFDPRADQVLGETVDMNVTAHVVEVTGISDAPAASAGGSAKIVEFQYNYDFGTLPSELRDFFKDHPTLPAKRLLRLYDDGWRVEHSHF